MKLFKKNKKKGFTLVELIVVIVIVAILAAALVTSLIGYINKAKNTNALVEGNNVYVAAQSIISEDIGTNATPKFGTKAATGVYTATAATIAPEINTYLGKDGLVDAADLKKCVTDAKGTVTDFEYITSNGETVTYTTAGGWQTK